MKEEGSAPVDPSDQFFSKHIDVLKVSGGPAGEIVLSASPRENCMQGHSAFYRPSLNDEEGEDDRSSSSSLSRLSKKYFQSAQKLEQQQQSVVCK